MAMVKEKDVKCEVMDTLEQQAITLKANTVLKNETRDTEITIRAIGKNQFEIIGKIETSNGRTHQINKRFSGHPHTIAPMLSRIISEARVKRGFF
jgi:predicted DNA binding protein